MLPITIHHLQKLDMLELKKLLPADSYVTRPDASRNSALGHVQTEILVIGSQAALFAFALWMSKKKSSRTFDLEYESETPEGGKTTVRLNSKDFQTESPAEVVNIIADKLRLPWVTPPANNP